LSALPDDPRSVRGHQLRPQLGVVGGAMSTGYHSARVRVVDKHGKTPDAKENTV
jgi:hypothetical protein